MFRIPSALFAALVSAVPSAAKAASEGARPSIVVLALEDAVPAGSAKFALVLRTMGALDAIGGVNVFHPKQTRAVLETHGPRLAALGDKKRIEAIGVTLGADYALSVGVTALAPKAGIILQLVPLSGAMTPSSKTLEGKTLLEALDQVPKALADLLAASKVLGRGASAEIGKVAPWTSSEEALLRYSECAETLNRQPIGIREPVLVDADKLDRAIAACEAALKIDPAFIDAHAALGLAFALKDNQALAERHLLAAKNAPGFSADYAVAKFWIISRFYDRNRAVAPLEEAVAKNPGCLLARGYLGEALTTLHRYDDAMRVFVDYLAAVPRQPWVMARIGLVYAKKGDLASAESWTQKALAVAPDDPELLLEMASRHVDAKDWKGAEEILQKILALGHARGEVHLRLGYVYLETNRLGQAEAQFENAIDQAAKVLEWRTRGRARYDLAKMWMRAGLADRAYGQLKLALDEGFRDWKKIDDDPDLKPLQADPKFKKLKSGNPARSYLPKYASPYKLDLGTGDIAPEAPSDTRNQTVVFRF